MFEKIDELLGSSRYTRKASSLWANQNYGNTGIEWVAEYGCFILCDMLNVDPRTLRKETKLVEDLRMDETEPLEVSLALKEDGFMVTPEDILEGETLDGFISALSKIMQIQQVGIGKVDKAHT